MKEKKWWIIQVLRGIYNTFGPYSSEDGAKNRYEKTSGGEIFLWESWEEDPQKVIDEFKAGRIDNG